LRFIVPLLGSKQNAGKRKALSKSERDAYRGMIKSNHFGFQQALKYPIKLGCSIDYVSLEKN
tara:strand:+ start:54 stop:239 length:186 start_codon:yes stop_codon:yes gene_type:complete